MRIKILASTSVRQQIRELEGREQEARNRIILAPKRDINRPEIVQQHAVILETQRRLAVLRRMA